MNFCILLLCISTSGIYLKTGTNKKEAIFYSLRDLYLEQKKNPSINNQNKITPLETEFKAMLYEDFLEELEDWEIERKASYLGPPPKSLPPSMVSILENFRQHPEDVKNKTFEFVEAHFRKLMIYDLDSELSSNPERFMTGQKTTKKKRIHTPTKIPFYPVLLILLFPIIYFIFKKRTSSKG
ncbi:MAG: hypothetical protein ACHQYQ_01155 [Bacteriovoracales bacterium]